MLAYVVTAGCSIEVKSYGCCTDQRGYVRLNGVAVWQAAQRGTYPNLRGVNILSINPLTCSAQEARRFDTYSSATHATELSDYLQQLTDGTVIVGTTGDEPHAQLANALPTLQLFGIDVANVQRRGSFAFMAQKGFPAKTVIRKILTETESRLNPAYFNADVTGIQSFSTCSIIINVRKHFSLEDSVRALNHTSETAHIIVVENRHSPLI